MVIRILTACAGLALSTAVFAQDAKPAAAPVKAQPVAPATAPAAAAPQNTAPVPGQPQITFDELSHDFGVIDDEKPVPTKFKFTNTGTGTLQISETKGSCGCTVPALEKKEYQPGESGEVSVTYNPHGRKGKQSTSVTVTSNDPARPSQILQVHSDVKPLFFIEPISVNFGQAPRGKPSTQTVLVTSRQKDLTPTQAVCSVPGVSAKMGEPKEVVIEGETLTQTPIEVSLLPNVEIGRLNGSITVRTTKPDRYPSFNIMGEVVGDIAAAPTMMQIPALKPSAPFTSQVALSSRSGKPFKITKVEEVPAAPSTTKAFTDVRFTEDTSVTPSRWMVSVTGTAPSSPSNFRGELVFATDLPDQPTFKLVYTGFVSNPQAQTGAPMNDPWASNPSSLRPSSR